MGTGHDQALFAGGSERALRWVPGSPSRARSTSTSVGTDVARD